MLIEFQFLRTYDIKLITAYKIIYLKMEIVLGEVALVSEENFDELIKYKWWMHESGYIMEKSIKNQ